VIGDPSSVISYQWFVIREICAIGGLG
jgi:hypothetical protein